MIPPGNDHWYPESWKQGKFFTKFYHFLWERQKLAGAQFGAFLWDRVASQTLALLRWWTMSLPFVWYHAWNFSWNTAVMGMKTKFLIGWQKQIPKVIFWLNGRSYGQWTGTKWNILGYMTDTDENLSHKFKLRLWELLLFLNECALYNRFNYK